VSDALLAWAIVVPLMAGALSALLMWAQSFGRTPQHLKRWLDVSVLVILVLGLLAEGLLLLFSSGAATLFGVTLAITLPARVALVAANVSLLSPGEAGTTARRAPHAPGQRYPLWWYPASLPLRCSPRTVP
jgi:hypothetical protein